MIVDSKQRAESRVVQVLQSNSNHAWLQGLKQGEQVIVKEPTLILAGMKVSVNMAELASGAF
jgi:nitrous oxidase accessory protein NosD